MQNMHNMHNTKYAEICKICKICKISTSAYFKKIWKNMTNTPTGSRIPSGCSSYFPYFLKIWKIRDPSTYFLKICKMRDPSTYFAYFRVKTYEHLRPCEGLRESMAVAMGPRRVANSSMSVTCE